MKQPELGQKIADLRKAKGLTQEELVEQCNISVRTIQRIETGEVTPRSYTVKALFAALEYDGLDERNGPILSKTQKNGLLAGGIAGVFYFLLGFPEGLMDFYRFSEDLFGFQNASSSFGMPPALDFSTITYQFIKVLVLITYIPFALAFMKIGQLVNNSLLRTIALILLSTVSLILLYDVVSLYFNGLGWSIANIGISVVFGLLSIIFGVALIQSRAQLGSISLIAGIIEIIAGVMLIFINPLGLILQMPAELLEAIILFQAINRFSSRAETSFS